jgi:N-acetyl-anhydromuramyl-L-alanine amidase AmpD
MMRIDSETYAIPESNRYKTQIAKTQIVLATSLRKDNNHIIRLQNKDYHKTKKWNTYTISRDGMIYQHFDPIYNSDFLGIKEIDKKTISIVLENMGCLFAAPNDKYINWINEVCEIENVVEKQWLGYNFWEKFPDEQIESIVMLCRRLCDDFNIPKMLIEFHHFNKEIHKFRGIVFRSNYIEDCSDINPLFDIPKFNEMLRNEII